MASKADLEKAKFDGLILPFKMHRIRGKGRRHAHEYRLVPGAKNEKHGRGLYEFSFDCEFHNTAQVSPPLWPDQMKSLRRLFETQETKTLIVPSIGPVLAFIENWEEENNAAILSGQAVTISLVEDDENDFLTEKITATNAANLVSSVDSYKIRIDTIEDKPSLLDQIFDAANELLAIRDQAQLQTQLLSAKIAAVTGLIDEADGTLSYFNDIENHEVLRALHDLWFAVVSLASNPGSDVVEPRKFITPRQMTIAEISSRIYGTAARSRDLMALNYFEDALAIRAGTSVTYIPE